ncbi:MAG: hypothetical protein E5V74_10490, partial [Mesorhizobium sp.]
PPRRAKRLQHHGVMDARPVAGGIAAWFVVAHIMTLPSHFMPEVAVATILVSLTVTVGIGLAGTWRVLGHKAAPVLRNL